MSKRPEIFIVTGPFAGRSFEVRKGGVHLGRSSACDVQIADEELSRRHCLFEPFGDQGVRLTDLSSANGTFLNGALVGNTPVELKTGDSIEVGKTMLRVGANFENEPTVCVGRVDLGLGDTPAEASPEATAPRKTRTVRLALAAVAALAVGVTAWVLFHFKPGEEESFTPLSAATPAAAEQAPVLREFAYEYVKADLKGIFRHELTLSADGVLTARVDDVPDENRHINKSVRLGEEAQKELSEMMGYDRVKDLDREYVGPEPEPAALESRTLRIVYSSRARYVHVANTSEPEAFKTLRVRLESFAKTKLGMWAVQYPREKLVELAQQSLDLADQKWNDRDVEHGNLWAAITAYREVVFYLDTVNPKPACHDAAVAGLTRAQAELDRRVEERRFAADRARHLGHWDDACRELRTLIEMVPDRNDERNRTLRDELVAAEKEQKKGAK